jgi:hypothetical protein
MSYQYKAWLAKKDACRCAGCLDRGFRIYVSPGVSLNAEAAEASGIKGRKESCPSCMAKIERASEKPALQECLTVVAAA